MVHFNHAAGAYILAGVKLLLLSFLFWLLEYHSICNAFSISSTNVQSTTTINGKKCNFDPVECGRIAFTFMTTAKQSSASQHNDCTDYDIDKSLPSQSQRLTVIIPAYNEFGRIGSTLTKYHRYLCDSTVLTRNWKINIVVVDDGSIDGTANVVRNFDTLSDKVPVSCISMKSNQGKGAAIAFGIHHVETKKSERFMDDCNSEQQRQKKHQEQQLILVADADASADISCLDDMIQTLYQNKGCVMVVGNRGYPSSIKRSILRWGFRSAVKIICGDLGVNDTQCGFKLMGATEGDLLYRDLNIKGWSHDVEVLYGARGLHMLVKEQRILWEDQDGSKLVSTSNINSVVLRSLEMLIEVITIQLQYLTGNWKVPSKTNQ